MDNHSRKNGIILAVSLLVLAAGAQASAGIQSSAATHVLFLSSWSRDMPWQRAIDTGLEREILAHKLPLRLYREYIDGGRFPLIRTANEFYRLFKAKYANTRMDLVISEGFPAAMMMQQVAGLFPEARKLVVQGPLTGPYPEDNDLWRITIKQDYARAIEAMIEAYDPQGIVVVVDVAEAHGESRLADFKQGLEHVGTRLPVTYLTGPSLAAIADRTAELPEKTAIFYLLYFRDGKGNRLSPFDAVQQIALTANAPIFSHWDTLMGSGVVGGYLISGEKAGAGIADIIAAFAENRSWGQTPGGIPDNGRFFEYQYDWRQLKRWHISKQRLPDSARIFYDTPGLYESYPLEMTLLLSFVGVLVILLSALVFETLKRRKISKQLSQNQEHLNAIFKANPDPVVVFDAEGIVQYVNPEFNRLFGWTVTQLNGWQFPFVVQKHQKEMRAMITQVAAQKGPVQIQIDGLSKNGNKIPMLASAAMIHGTNSDCAGVVVNLTDISSQKKLENQLRQAQKMEAIGKLAGGVAHDYNNISTIVIGYCELALEKVSREEPLHSDLTEILSAARRSSDITRQLLAFARRQTISPKVMVLNGVLEGLLKMLRRLIGEDIDLVWLPQADLWPIKIDPSQIDQILANLCINARDAITDVGKVTIETRNITFDEEYCSEHPGFIPGDFVSIAFSDDGVGIAPEDLDQIFEPFFTSKELGKGTGLGLATVYGIVKQNNGFINVYSELGNGTCFKLYFPRHTGPVVALARESRQETPMGNGESVLLVEDDGPILALGTRMLETLGYSVLTAATPSEAIRIAKQQTQAIHLLITDVVMPEMNGRELSERLAAFKPNIKTLYMSGYTANVIVHRGILEEGVFYIPKPLSKKELAHKIKAILNDTDHGG